MQRRWTPRPRIAKVHVPNFTSTLYVCYVLCVIAVHTLPSSAHSFALASIPCLSDSKRERIPHFFLPSVLCVIIALTPLITPRTTSAFLTLSAPHVFCLCLAGELSDQHTRQSLGLRERVAERKTLVCVSVRDLLSVLTEDGSWKKITYF